MTSQSTNWNPRGSEWHRWDPHIHAPGTVNADNFGGDWSGYIKAINDATPVIRALGITDYYSLHTYREVRQLKDAGNLANIGLIFPNIEVRLDVKTARAKGINLHFLFSPDDPQHETEIERILGQLTFEFDGAKHQCNRAGLVTLGRKCEPKHTTESAAFAEGVQQFKINFPQLRELFRSEVWLRENCLVAIAAAQGDGAAGLQGDDAFKAMREEMQRFAHIIFSGKLCDREYWLGQREGESRQTIERKYRGLKPCIHGSDAHEIAKVGAPDENRFCWIKGDLAFESLRQAAIEPEERVWIGEDPPLAPAPSVTLDTLRPMRTPWLSNETVPLNSGLVAVIGARGSGKTALVDLIAAGAGALSQPLAESSFLRRATHPVDLIGPAKVEELWRDGYKSTADFRPPSDDVVDAQPPVVCYLSQQFVDRLCSSEGLASELRREIERVIFDQIDQTNRLGTDSFVNLEDVQLDPVRHRRQQQTASVTSNSIKIADEQRLIDQLGKLRADRETLSQTLAKQKKDLDELIPKGKEERAKRLFAIETACTDSENKVEALRKKIGALDNLLAEANYVRTQAEPERFAEMQERFTDSGLTAAEWEAFRQKFSGDIGSIVASAKQSAARQSRLQQEGDPQNPVDLAIAPLGQWPLTTLRVERDKLKKEVGVDAERQKKYDVLKKAIGTNEAALKKADAIIKHAEGADDRRNALVQTRRGVYRAVFDTFVEEQTILAQLYEPLHLELKDATGALSKLRFVVKRHVNLDQWVTAGEELLDLRKEARFRGHGKLAEEASKVLLFAWQTGTAETVATAMHMFVAESSKDLRLAMPGSVAPEGRAEWFRQLGDWLYSTSHISIEYGLEYDGTNVEQLSPGTRGIVLLLLYLAIDRNDRRPLLIDQPEENLDPKSVYRDLVPHFREARKRRQVIIVTHNANLVVNTDADQVIVASATPTEGGGLPLITYQSGSLENPDIRHAVCDILEGGERAFLERERRYRLQWEQMLAE